MPRSHKTPLWIVVGSVGQFCFFLGFSITFANLLLIQTSTIGIILMVMGGGVGVAALKQVQTSQ